MDCVFYPLTGEIIMPETKDETLNARDGKKGSVKFVVKSMETIRGDTTSKPEAKKQKIEDGSESSEMKDESETLEMEDGSESSEMEDGSESSGTEDEVVDEDEFCEGQRGDVVDVLEPTKKIKEFDEFNFDFDDVLTNPDYKFGISRISSLVKHEDMELLGKPFEIPFFDFPLQIKCVVNYDKFQLFVAFMKSKKDGTVIPKNASPRIITAIIHSLGPELNTPDGLFCYNFPEGKEIIWDTFYPFCTFSYEHNVAGISTLDQDYIVLHFLIRNCCSKNDVLVEDGILLWKVDALISKLKAGVTIEEEDEVGLSPVFYKDPKGMRVQVRLFTRGTESMVQVNFYNETKERLNYSPIDFKILHPRKPSRSIDFAFDPVEHQLVDLEPQKRSSVSFQFAKVEELVLFVDRYLWVKVKM